MNLYLKHFLGLFLGILVVVVGLNYLVDPYRIFHKPWVRDNYYPNDYLMRVEASGIINTEDFDSIILGNSASENFSANDASQIFGTHYVNISLSGSSMIERNFVLHYALKKRKIKQVVFQLEGLYPRIKALSDTEIGPYRYLYDQYAINDLLIYMMDINNSRYLLCSNILPTIDSICKNNKKNIETLIEWGSNPENQNRFGGIDKWFKAKNNLQIQNALKTISSSINKINTNQVSAINLAEISSEKVKYKQSVETEMLTLVQQHPSTEFYLFFPPYSRLKYAITQQSDPQAFENYKEIIRLMVSDFEQYPNVKIFGFEREDFLDDIANYKDLTHYHPHYNRAMLEWMQTGKHQLTTSNLDAYLSAITEKSAHYQLQGFADKIDVYLGHAHRLQ